MCYRIGLRSRQQEIVHSDPRRVGDPLEQDPLSSISVYGNARVVADIGDRDPREKVGGGDAEGRDVKNILAAAGIVIKIDDRVPAEPRPEHENVVVPAADQGVIAGPADENIVASSPVE